MSSARFWKRINAIVAARGKKLRLQSGPLFRAEGSAEWRGCEQLIITECGEIYAQYWHEPSATMLA
jgi:hypothetical protein